MSDGGFLQLCMFKACCSSLSCAMFALSPLKMPNGCNLKIVQGMLNLPLKYLLSPFCHPKGVVFIQAVVSCLENSEGLQAVDEKILHVKQDCMYSSLRSTMFGTSSICQFANTEK